MVNKIGFTLGFLSVFQRANEGFVDGHLLSYLDQRVKVGM